MNKMKELAQLRQQTNAARTSRTIERESKNQSSPAENSNGLSAYEERKDAATKGNAAANLSVNMVQHAMSSLSGVRDSKKFGEVLDKMFVPTVQAYRQKEKERPFRRPT